ncbi:aldo/keto reductase [Kutzneria sp. CA-103260]|uniref:aldo/keto reductase n=1 Tax=Kutzneria sp. CA-103260 TaxID=2802641 RepID=UPI001BA9901A|nr:aldo/keto reductase [Kutzneria sp. CA-103260]QUQ69566.1 aldo/keto reductase [Kutzneria sp. CA-103260]
MISGLGFGGAPIANLYTPVSDVDARATVDAAWDAGVRYFDTAPHYGLGLSERRLGAALSARPRDEFVISTKVGRVLEPFGGGGLDDAGFLVPATHRRVWDFSADGIRRSLDASLARLGLDHVDIVYLHDPDNHWEQAISEGLPALQELKSQGVIRGIGVGMNQWQMPERFIREGSLDYVMLAGRYTLLEQESLASFLPLCLDRGVSVVSVGVFNSGLLARPEVPSDATYNYSAAPASMLERARRIASVCSRHGAVLPQAALQFPFGHPAVKAIAVGARTPGEITENAALFADKVSPDLWAELKVEGLLAHETPTP